MPIFQLIYAALYNHLYIISKKVLKKSAKKIIREKENMNTILPDNSGMQKKRTSLFSKDKEHILYLEFVNLPAP